MDTGDPLDLKPEAAVGVDWTRQLNGHVVERPPQCSESVVKMSLGKADEPYRLVFFILKLLTWYLFGVDKLFRWQPPWDLQQPKIAIKLNLLTYAVYGFSKNPDNFSFVFSLPFFLFIPFNSFLYQFYPY